MTDTSTPPEQPVQPELPEEHRGKSRMWLYFAIGIAALGLLVVIARSL